MADNKAAKIASKLAHFIKAIIDIIKGFGQGGWYGAAAQFVKNFWPQLLGIAAALILIPLIIFFCLPMVLFGYASSTYTEIADMTQKAATISACYDRYETYIDDWVAEIKNTVIGADIPNTEINGPTDNSEPEPAVEYEVVIQGEKIQKKWFTALHAVSVGNDLNKATEENVRMFARKCVDYTVTQVEGETTPGDSDPSEPGAVKMLLEIRYLSPTEIMAACGYTEMDENWSRLIYKTLEMSYDPNVGMLGSLFSDDSWRNHITSNYGYRTYPYTGFHQGIDIGMPMGTPICAVKDGTVSSAVYGTSGYGYYIILDHGDGVQTLYAHCSQLLVVPGTEVTKGQVIAKVGSTGRSTGPHVHFEVRINGEAVDPSPYLP